MTIGKSIEVIPVVLCGGFGSRLWPLSRSGFPKQFLDLFSRSGSLFQQAMRRINLLNSHELVINSTLVITNEEHRFLALDQLREINHEHSKLLLEPAGRNTAPALTIAALQALEDGFDPVMVVMSADQTIVDEKKFAEILQKSIQVAISNQIVILGVVPNKPETGYGYIKCLDDPGFMGEYSVAEFAEKPNLETALQYLSTGNYYWNSGIFILKASLWLKAIKMFRSDIVDATEKSWVNKKVDGPFVRPDKELFELIPSESIDYAVMEKFATLGSGLKMIPLNVGWSDLGAWDAVWEAGDADISGNVTCGDALLIDTTNTYIHSSSRLVTAVGLDNLIIVETPDAVLISDKSQSQGVKKIVDLLDKTNRSEKDIHRKVFRPWGWYDNIDEGENFKVKRIQVKPGASLSLQMHQHRAEHWVVVRGVAEITNGGEVIRLVENQSTYIPQGQVHRLKNIGVEILEIIEVQSGSYLGEDDIVRFEDTYGRAQ